MQLIGLPVGHFGRLKDGTVVINLGLFGPGGGIRPLNAATDSGKNASGDMYTECSDVTPQVLALLDDLDRTPPDDDYIFDVATTTAATLEGATSIPEFNLIIAEINDDLGGRLGVYQLCCQVARYLDKYRREFETEDYPGTFDYEVPTLFWDAWCEETNQVFRTEWRETGGHLVGQGWPAGAIKDRTSDSVLERIARTVVRLWFHPPCEWRVVLRKTEIRYVIAASFKEAYSMAVQQWNVDDITSLEKKS